MPYYDELLQMGNEIGDHSYTHLINPPTAPVSETLSTASAAAGATQITVDALPSYNGATLGMVVSDANRRLRGEHDHHGVFRPMRRQAIL